MTDLGSLRDEFVNSCLDRLNTIQNDLVGHHRELAALRAQRTVVSVESWFHADAETIRERDRRSDWATRDADAQIEKVRGEVAALTEERDGLRFQLTQLRG